MKRLLVFATTAWALLSAGPVQAQFLVENLGRGVVALRTAESSVYVGWRLLGTDPAGIAFNLYRATGDEPPVKLNGAPLTATTDFVDSTADLAQPNAYTVRPVLGGTELAACAAFVLPADPPILEYLTIPLQRPAGGSVAVPPGNPTGNYTYSPNDASVADLDTANTRSL
jgi:rhamnogalacturonan endolyase